MLKYQVINEEEREGTEPIDMNDGWLVGIIVC